MLGLVSSQVDAGTHQKHSRVSAVQWCNFLQLVERLDDHSQIEKPLRCLKEMKLCVCQFHSGSLSVFGAEAIPR